MKKFISLLICLILLVGIASCAYALDISAIQPDTNVYIIGITDTDVPVTGSLYTCYDYNNSTIIIPQEKLNSIYTNPITNQPIEKNNNNIENTPTTLPEDKTQAVEYQIDKEETIEKIFELTNKARQENNLPALTYNKDIQDAADLRAKEISTKFSHTRPDGSNCHTVVEKFEYRVTGENLIMADNPISEPEILLDTWMNSEGHRANILLPDFTSIAIGLYEKDDVTYAVQIFMG